MLDKKYSVTKSNLMTEMRNCKFTLGEQRLLAVFLSRVNPKDPTKKREVTFTFDEFRSLLDLKSTNRVYWQKTFDSLVSKTIKFEYRTNKYSAWTTCTVFSSATMYRDEETEALTIKLTANESIEPLIFDLKKYLKYQLWNCLRLSSNNQIRMYELLKQYESVGERTIPINDLKEMLGLSVDDYPIWERFKTKVLESCKKALKENTDIYFEYEPVKRGRKFASVKFSIYKNTDYKDPLKLDEFIEQQPEFPSIENFEIEAVEPEQELTDFQSFLSEAVDEEFNSKEELELIFDRVVKLTLEEHPLGLDFARFHFVQTKYLELKFQSKTQHISNRFKYFLGMLK